MGEDTIEAARRRRAGEVVAFEVPAGGSRASWPADAPAPPPVPSWREEHPAPANGTPPPFASASFRDFMLYERHAVDAARDGA
ncbi:hypothetical protein [Streptomyces sp. GbtcB6]|uniref:hypothetical protein n=1 Tax=Streptomyces sp. GbtcB6 TaxID=2824751 RepID=UPI001C304AD1|nr:hypothetical protein [Streptomyces sp. GbtcB6]